MARIPNKQYMNRCLNEIIEKISQSNRTVQFSVHYEDAGKEFLSVSVKDDTGVFNSFELYSFRTRKANAASMQQIFDHLK